MPIPGSPGAYVANGSEHDDIGDTTHLPERHIQMTQRRFSKIKLLEEDDYEREGAEHSVAILPWGGSKGPAREAYDILKQEGVPVGRYYTMFLNPLPPRLLEELKQKDLVIVPELNYQGQFSNILRGLGVKAESITQYTRACPSKRAPWWSRLPKSPTPGPRRLLRYEQEEPGIRFQMVPRLRRLRCAPGIGIRHD